MGLLLTCKGRGMVWPKVKNEVPAAIVVHCFGHCLNLCLQSAGRKLDSLDLVKEIAKLIKFSPKRPHLLQKLE